MRSVIATLALAACSSPPPPAASPAAPAPAPTTSAPAAPAAPAAPSESVTLADVGLEAASLDRSVDPCVDFYQFACGGWLRENSIPAERARWARFSEIDERNRLSLRTLLDDAARLGGDANTKKLGDFYAACMDEAAIESGSLAALRPLLDKTTKVKDARSWLAAVAELHRVGVPVVWAETAEADFKDSRTYVTYLSPSGLGLPDRDYYVKPELADKLAAYTAHVGRMLTLRDPATKPSAASDVVAIESALAAVTKTATEARDVAGAYNPTDAAKLAKQLKLDWKTYWKLVGHTPSKKLVVTTPAYFTALDKLRSKFKPAQWASYFTYHLLARTAFSLPRTFDNEMFELAKVLTGVEAREERGKRCTAATERSLGELLGQQYVAKYFSASARQTANLLVDAIVKAMGEQIGQLAWMTPETRATAQTKLGKLARMIGYPDTWRRYEFDVRRDDFIGNRLRASAAEQKRVLVRAGKPVDRSEWQMNAYQVDAYYDATANTTALPAGILQPPFFGADRSIAANLGGIGMLIGHELTHGFDDQGARFDADGNLVDWWAASDKQQFTERGACLAEQYSGFEAARGQFVNGKLTLGENIADLGGVKMAYTAYRALRRDAVKTVVADGFSEDQQFFIAVGQAWCSKDRPAELIRRLTTDTHAPPAFRIYGALRNMKEFAGAFRCAAGTPMNPATPCTVW